MAWTTPRTWTTEVTTQTHWNGHVRDNLKAILPLDVPRWTDFTPTWTATSGTQPSFGNGFNSSRYTKLGRTVWAQYYMVAGSTTTFGTAGTYLYGLPQATSATLQPCVSMFGAIDPGVHEYGGFSHVSGTSNFEIRAHGTASALGGPFSRLVPFTFANGDVLLYGQLKYEAAS
jgi:hypothetical protein